MIIMLYVAQILQEMALIMYDMPLCGNEWMNDLLIAIRDKPHLY